MNARVAQFAIGMGILLLPFLILAPLHAQTAQAVVFEKVTKGDEIRISGTIPAKLSDFKIDPPSLLALPVKNEIPVRVEMSWRREK